MTKEGRQKTARLSYPKGEAQSAAEVSATLFVFGILTECETGWPPEKPGRKLDDDGGETD